MASTILRLGKIEAVEGPAYSNEADGLRIKARLPQDGKKPVDEIEWAFPLLPKMFQTAPQIGEGALIITAEANDTKSQRFYIAPIIPQPQYMGYAPYLTNNDVASSLIQGHNTDPLGKISNYAATNGAFPKFNDVALVGRGREDVRLKYSTATHVSETDITAGIRVNPTNSTNPDIKGNVIFNDKNPSYIQVQHGPGISSQGESFINIVGEKINLISHNDTDVNDMIVDQDNLIQQGKLDDVIDKLHPAVKGDRLVELLKLMIGAIREHVHPWAGMRQCGDWENYINRMEAFDVDSVLSEDVKLS